MIVVVVNDEQFAFKCTVYVTELYQLFHYIVFVNRKHTNVYF